jgi:O-acetyl-ADP-ribose deacetylase (regulator of RNase III)
VTTLRVFSGDITTLAVGAIVNAANSSLLGGGGVDGAIHAAGGPAILADCKEIVASRGPCPPGDAVVTGAGELPAGLVIHTVGPIWSDGQGDEHKETLASCYRRSLELGCDHGVQTIAFPNISTGVYGFPKPLAASVAIDAVIGWIDDNPAHDYHEIIFACFDEENRSIYEALLGERR